MPMTVSHVESEPGISQPRLSQSRLQDGDTSALRLPSVDVHPSEHTVPAENAGLELLIALLERKRMILRTTVTAAVCAAVISLFFSNRYTATATILPPQQSPSLAASIIGQLGGLGSMAGMVQKDLGLKNPNDIYIGMLRSRTIEDGLIRRFHLMHLYGEKKLSNARLDLDRASAIELSKEGLVSISVEDKDPGRAAQMANAYVDELRNLTQNLAMTEAGQRRLFFEQQMETAQARLADAEQALKQTQQKTGLIELDGQAKAIIESVVKLRAAVAAKEIELHAMRLSLTEQNPDLIAGERQLAAMRSELSRLEQSDNFGTVQIPTGKVPEAGLEYVRKLRDLKYAETIWELLTKQYEAARLDESRNAAIIQIVDPALEPDQKSSPHRTLIVLIVSFLGLLGASAYALVAEAFSRARLNPDTDVRLSRLKAALFGNSAA